MVRPDMWYAFVCLLRLLLLVQDQWFWPLCSFAEFQLDIGWLPMRESRFRSASCHSPAIGETFFQWWSQKRVPRASFISKKVFFFSESLNMCQILTSFSSDASIDKCAAWPNIGSTSARGAFLCCTRISIRRPSPISGEPLAGTLLFS